MISRLFYRLFRRIPRATVDVVAAAGPTRWRSIEGEEFEITQSYRLDGELNHILLDGSGDYRYMSDEHLKRTLTPDDRTS
jgi:hypothetical protein